MAEHEEGARTGGYCGKCGYPIREGFRFCGKCGAPAVILRQRTEVPEVPSVIRDDMPEAPTEEPERKHPAARKPVKTDKPVPEKKTSKGKPAPKKKALRWILIISAVLILAGAGIFAAFRFFILNGSETVRAVTAPSRDITMEEAASLLSIQTEQIDGFYQSAGNDGESVRYTLDEKKYSDFCRMDREITLELKHAEDGTWQGTPVYGPWQAEWHVNGTWQLYSPGEVTVKVLEANATTVRMEFSAVIDGKQYYGSGWYPLSENQGADGHCLQTVKPDGDMPGWFRLSDEAGIELVTENGSKATTMIRTENSEPENWMAEDEEENAG